MKRLIGLLLLVLIGSLTSAQEDGLNLPTELYTLVNEGQVQRYGLGAAGVAPVTPEGEVVVDFGVAPDGIMLAYRTENALIFRNMLTEESREIEGATAGIPPFRGEGSTIAWSPDGTTLAYTTEFGVRFRFETGEFFDIAITPLLNLVWSPNSTYLAAEAENNIWWVYRRDGTQMMLISALPSSVGFEWVGPGLLMFAPETGGLFLMDVSSGNAQSQISDERTLFRMPSLRRDGTVSIFARPANDSSLEPSFAYLYRVTPAGDNITIEQVSETAIDLTGLRWAPAGNLMITLQGGVMALVDPVSGQGFVLPATGVVALGWGALRPASAAAMRLTATAYFIADDGTGIEQLWVIAPDASQAIPVLFAEASVTAFAARLDGETFAYHSGGQLWFLPAGIDTATPLLEIEALHHLTFSPDGTMLAYDADDAIYTLPVSGGEPQLLLTGYTYPQYAPDGTTLLVRIGDGDLGIYDMNTGEVGRFGAFKGGRWLADGRVLLYGALTAGGEEGVYVADRTIGAQPTLLYAAPQGMQIAGVGVTSANNVRILQTRSAPAPLTILEIPLTGGAINNLGSPGYIGDPVFSPGGGFIAGYASAAGTLVIYSVEEQAEVTLLQPARAHDLVWSSFR